MASLTATDGTNGNDLFYVYGTAAGTPVSLYTLGRYDDVVSESNSNLNAFQAALTVHGSGVYNNLILSDYSNPTRHTFTLSTSGSTGTLSRDGIAPFTFDGIGQLVVYVPLVGGNHFNVLAVLPNVTASLTASNGDQDVVGSQAPNQGGTMAAVQGSVSFGFEATVVSTPPSVTFDDSADETTAPRQVTVGVATSPDSYRYVTNLAGNGTWDRWNLPAGSAVNVLGRAGGNETFAMEPFQSSVGPVIQVGGSNNTLDYSAYVGDIRVNLPLGTATALAGIRGIENVNGSQGNDLIVGAGSAGTLQGGSGRNLIVGGSGQVTLIGGPQDDILIAGYTDYDTTPGALDAVLTAWESNQSYSQRIATIQAGVGGPGGMNVRLTNKTVHHAVGVRDTLTGGYGQDWFFALMGANGDIITDLNLFSPTQKKAEIVTPIK
jgi:hypothetical protein